MTLHRVDHAAVGNDNTVLFAHAVVQENIIARYQINLVDHIGEIIGCDAVDRDRTAAETLVYQHHLTPALIFFMGELEGNADRFHEALTGRQAVARRIQVDMFRVQAVGAVVAVVDARVQALRGYPITALPALVIKPVEGLSVSHRSSFIRI